MDENCLLSVLKISKTIVADVPSSFCILFMTFASLFPLLSILLMVDYSFLKLLKLITLAFFNYVVQLGPVFFIIVSFIAIGFI